MENQRFVVVGLGASAGGLEPLQAFLAAAPEDAGHAYIVVQHLSPDFKSLMPELLRRHTTMPVVPIDQDIQLAPNTVHVLSPGLVVSLEGTMLRTQPRQPSAAPEFPISICFSSLAPLGRRAVAIVLSGTGSDGTAGAQLVHASGGLVIAQLPGTARFEAMPRCVIDSGCADIVTAPADMPRAIAGWIADPVQGRHFGSPAAPADPEAAGEYGSILAILNATYNIDFQHYKPGTIIRRIERRLLADPVPVTPVEYGQRLAVDRDELDRLFGDLLVGVTRFFRDEEMYLQLQSAFLEGLVETMSAQDELRIWSCGCSTGEEAYSLAMLAIEIFERHDRRVRLRVLATDLHGAALRVASQGLYSSDAVACVPEDLRHRHFVRQPSGMYRVSDDLRRTVIFSAHNVLQDAAFTRIDLVTCRNLLIYLQPQAQRRALAAFHFALRSGGALFLGDSEGVNELPGAFEPVARDAHLFRKLPGSRVPAEMRGPVLTRYAARAALPQLDLRASKVLDEIIMQRYLPDCLLVNAQFELVHVYGRADRFLQARPGRFGGDLAGLLRPPLRTAVTLALRKAAQHGETVMLPDLPDDTLPGARLSITIEPLVDRALPQAHYMVRLTSQPPEHCPPRPLASIEPNDQASLQAQQMAELETELARVREALQHTIEDLESANEELQAGNEELMAANEELQSTNEELHAVNEELYSVNSEHECKINELRETTADLNNLIHATELGILFLDTSLRLRMFTPATAALFPLQPRDIGRDLRDFMPREADESLLADLLAAQAGVAGEMEPQRLNREFQLSDGRWLRRHITPYRDNGGRNAGLVLTYVDISEQVRLREVSLQRAGMEFLDEIVLLLPHQLCTLDEQLQLTWMSPQLATYLGLPGDTRAADAHAVHQDALHPEDAPAVTETRKSAQAGGRPYRTRYRLRRHDGTYRWFTSHTVPRRDAAGHTIGWLGAAIDVHDLFEAQQQLIEREDLLRLVTDNIGNMVFYCDTRGVSRFANPQVRAWFGNAVEQPTGRPGGDTPGADAWIRDQPQFQAALEGRRQTVERSHRDPEGRLRHALVHYVPHIVDGQTRGVIVSVNDVTPIVEARVALDDLVDNLPVALLVVATSGRIVRANASASALTGHAQEALLGMMVEDLVPVAQQGRHRQLRLGFQAAPQIRLTGQPSGRSFGLLRADGTTMDVDIALVPCSDHGDPATMAVLHDAREHTLRRSDDARRADTSRRNFLATMSHEIRTPLNAIMGMAQLMELESPTLRQMERLKGIEDASRHLLSIVNDVLDLAQIDSGHLKEVRAPFDVAALVDRSLAMVADRAKLKALELATVVDGQVPARVMGDERRIEQILVNLLSNAVKFTPSGSVRVLLAGREISDQIQLRFEVHDTGIGISAELMPRLFRPFEQLDQSFSRRHGGTGLGLAICRHLAAALGGDCGASSTEGVGSRFWFTVLVGHCTPDSDATITANATLQDAATVRAALHGRRLLVVEDDRVNQIILVDMLRTLGEPHVDVVSSGQEAIDTVANAQAAYDLIFMDVQLPGIDGLEATRQISALPLPRQPRIVALTANVLPQDVARCVSAGMAAHLPKPVVRTDLAREILRGLPADAPQGASTAAPGVVSLRDTTPS